MDTTRFATADEPADVAVIVVTYNSADDIGGLIDTVRADSGDLLLRVIVADNSSSDGTLDIARAHHDVVAVGTGGNLGYAGGINVAATRIGDAAAVLILNPDLRVEPGAIAAMLGTLDSDESLGIVVPRMLDENGKTYPSLRQEPTLLRAAADAVLGSRWLGRPAALSEYSRDLALYDRQRVVDWATGAALLLRRAAFDAIGAWDERFFLYSEETDAFRRARAAGWHVLYEPSAIVTHRGGGSGVSDALVALTVVNRVRYMDKHRPRSAGLYRAIVMLGEAARRDPTHARARWALRRRSRWSALPSASARSIPVDQLPQVSVIIPAHNEAAVIARTLAPLAEAAASGRFDIIVSCNGCTDTTALIARGFAGVTVIETDAASKAAALNAGDAVAQHWPRIYLDADIELRPEAIASVAETLNSGTPAARPSARMEDTNSDRWVRAYYRARRRMPSMDAALWGAGVYALSKGGHERLGEFPAATADDVVVDQLFSTAEKRIVQTAPAIVQAPRTRQDLRAILRRAQRGAAEQCVSTGRSSAMELMRSITGLRSLFDAAVYAAFAVNARRDGARTKPSAVWERDESSRSATASTPAVVDHVLLTRFNLPTPGPEALVRAQDGWLRNRVALFEKYTVPSITAQTCSEFRWIVYLDTQSPDWLREQLAPYIDAGLFVPLYRDEVTWHDVARDVREVTGARGEMLLTTNLDNDDAVAVDFIERLQDAARTNSPAALFLRRGLILQGTQVYMRDDPDNAFCSVAEPWDAPQTAWRDWHTLLHKHFRSVNIPGAPGWLQVIHGQNVSNKVHGTLTSPGAYRELFPGMLDEIPSLSATAALRDRVFRQPVRACASAVRTLGKNAFLVVFGKERLDNVKSRLQAQRS